MVVVVVGIIGWRLMVGGWWFAVGIWGLLDGGWRLVVMVVGGSKIIIIIN